MAGEPRVGLDRERVPARQLLAALDRIGEALAVALLRQVALELGDEQPPVREDQDAERARGVDEPGRGDRLARGGRVTEAVAPDRAGVGACQDGLVGLFLGSELVGLLVLLVGLELLERRAVSVQRRLVRLDGRDELREHPGERVDLVAPQLGAGGEPRRPVAQDALEAEHEPVAHLPTGGGLGSAGLYLGQRVVEREAARGAGGENLLGILPVVQERLACPGFCAERCGFEPALRRCRRMIGGLLHLCSTLRVLQLQ